MSLCGWVKSNSSANSCMYKKQSKIEVGTFTISQSDLKGLTQTGYKPQVLNSCSSYHYVK